MKVYELMNVLCTGQRVIILELGGKSYFGDPDSCFIKDGTSLGNRDVIRVKINDDNWGPVVEVYTWGESA